MALVGMILVVYIYSVTTKGINILEGCCCCVGVVMLSGTCKGKRWTKLLREESRENDGFKVNEGGSS